jgi:hypothetical protein
MFIINYKNYEFKFIINKNLDLFSTSNKITPNGNVSMAKVIINKNNNISSVLDTKLDLKKEEDEKKLINHILINLSKIIRELLDNGKISLKFNKGDYNVAININEKNILLKIEGSNDKERIIFSLDNNNSYEPRINIPYYKLLDDFSKNNDAIEFNKQINLNFANDIYRLIKYTIEFKKDFDEKIKLNQTNNNLSIEINKLKNQLILFKIGSGLSIVFLIIIIILFFKKSCDE